MGGGEVESHHASAQEHENIGAVDPRKGKVGVCSVLEMAPGENQMAVEEQGGDELAKSLVVETEASTEGVEVRGSLAACHR